jgi:hypothetical protein
MAKKAFIIILLAVLGGAYAYHFRLTHAECIPLQGVLVRWGDYGRRENIKAALKNIRANSAEDYERICTRVSSIRLARFEDQIVPTSPFDAQGTYSPDQSSLSAKGVITIDREAAGGRLSELEKTLVHEACHAFLIQTSGDFSETPCYSRAHKYLLARPKAPLAQQSAELIEETGEKFHAYCAPRTQDALAMQGECVFINYTTESKNMCAKVVLKQGGVNKVEKEVCGGVDEVGYRSLPFELPYPNGVGEHKEYRFEFSLLD